MPSMTFEPQHNRFDKISCPYIIHRVTEDFYLPRLLSDITGQTVVPIGDGVLVTMDTVFGSETCEELFTGKRYIVIISAWVQSSSQTMHLS